MRLTPIKPDELSDDQKSLYDDMQAGISKKFDDFEAIRNDGALLGPWNPWLHSPKIGRAVWDLTKVMSIEATLPAKAREIAILVTGAHFDAAYELYAHVNVAKEKGLPKETLSTLIAGLKPEGLSTEQSVAYDVAFALVNGGVLPRPTYDRLVDTFGQQGAEEMIHLVGLYCMVSITLNGFNVPVPDADM